MVYLHALRRRGIILDKLVIPRYSVTTNRVFRNAVTLQAQRGLNTQEMELSTMSSSPSKYELFFPSFYRGYVIDVIDSFLAIDKSATPHILHKLPTNYPMTCPDFEDKPHYTHDDDLHINEPNIIQKGQHFDVISLLSTHADDLVRIGSNKLVKADDLRGKYVFVCCGFVPSLWISTGSCLWRDLSLLSSELSQPHISIKHNIEIVIVPKMRRKWDNDEGVFDHFLSAFPGCLVVPFGDEYRRDFICKSLNFEGQKHRCILVDPSQTVLQVDFYPVVEYGARGFPFTDEHFTFLSKESRWTKPFSPSIMSLAGLLGCESDPSSFLLRKFDSDESISVEQLNKHHVGLYFFKEGYHLKEVVNIYQQCTDQGLDLEIVLVCLPFHTPIHPEEFQDVVYSVLKKHRVSNWWVFPYNNSAFIRLDDLCRSAVDSFFVVGPNNEFVDRQAKEVVRHFGPHFGYEAFPFTMEALVRAFLQRLGTVTLESFLTYDYLYQDYECDDTKIIPVSELKDKNVIVIVEEPLLGVRIWGILYDWYNVIKEKDPDLEMVYVPVVYSKPDSEYRNFTSRVRELIYKSKTKGLICPFEDPQQSQSLKYHNAFLLSKGHYSAKKGVPTPSALAFGKGGHLHSIDAVNLFIDNGLDAYPFLRESRNEVLRKEVMTELIFEFELMDDTAVSLKS